MVPRLTRPHDPGPQGGGQRKARCASEPGWQSEAEYPVGLGDGDLMEQVVEEVAQTPKEPRPGRAFRFAILRVSCPCSSCPAQGAAARGDAVQGPRRPAASAAGGVRHLSGCRPAPPDCPIVRLSTWLARVHGDQHATLWAACRPGWG